MSERAPARRMETFRQPETKGFLLTSEFWVAVIAAAAVLFATYVLSDMGSTSAWRFLTWIAVAYIVSRGIAKAGSQRDRQIDPASRIGMSDSALQGDAYQNGAYQDDDRTRAMAGSSEPMRDGR